MLNYFVDFVVNFVGLDATTSNILASILTVSLMIAVFYLLTKLVFPNDSTVKKIVFCAIWISCIIVIMCVNNVYPITIMQVSSVLGVLA